MKFLETHFEEYMNTHENLHPKMENVYNSFPEKPKDMSNVILYGAKGVGKYTQMLKCIKKYSPSGLKYEKKISITYNKQIYLFKISDIHYEIDMSLLGCNSKLLWHEIYNQLLDIISTKAEKTGIIVCKYFRGIATMAFFMVAYDLSKYQNIIKTKNSNSNLKAPNRCQKSSTLANRTLRTLRTPHWPAVPHQKKENCRASASRGASYLLGRTKKAHAQQGTQHQQNHSE